MRGVRPNERVDDGVVCHKACRRTVYVVMWCYCVSLVGVGVLRCLAIRVWLSVAQSQAKYSW